MDGIRKMMPFFCYLLETNNKKAHFEPFFSKFLLIFGIIYLQKRRIYEIPEIKHFSNRNIIGLLGQRTNSKSGQMEHQ